MRSSGGLPAQSGDWWVGCMTGGSQMKDTPQGFFLFAEMIR